MAKLEARAKPIATPRQLLVVGVLGAVLVTVLIGQFGGASGKPGDAEVRKSSGGPSLTADRASNRKPSTASAAREQRVEPATAPPAKTEGRFGELSDRFPGFKPLVVVAGFFTALLLVVKISSLISSPQLVRVIYLSFFLTVFVYGYKVYADHVVGSYFSVKQKVLSMFMKANEREGLPDRNVAGIDKP